MTRSLSSCQLKTGLFVEIADKVRTNTTIDWTIREGARSRLMVIARRMLNKYGYPPDMQLKAVETVMRQAELMAGGFLSEGATAMIRTTSCSRRLRLTCSNPSSRPGKLRAGRMGTETLVPAPPKVQTDGTTPSPVRI